MKFPQFPLKTWYDDNMDLTKKVKGPGSICSLVLLPHKENGYKNEQRRVL